MLESMSLQKNRIRSAKNVIFSLLCILVDRPMGGGLNPQNPPLRTPLVLSSAKRAQNKHKKNWKAQAKLLDVLSNDITRKANKKS